MNFSIENVIIVETKNTYVNLFSLFLFLKKNATKKIYFNFVIMGCWVYIDI